LECAQVSQLCVFRRSEMAGRRLIQLAVWQIKRCLWTEEHAATILYHFHNRMSDMVRLQKRASRSSARKIEADKQHSGIGSTLWQVILGRVVSGIGGAGMTALVSILITGMRLLPPFPKGAYQANQYRHDAAAPGCGMEKLRQRGSYHGTFSWWTSGRVPS
jgi:hypothetical protein